MPDQVDRTIRPGLIVYCQAGADSPLHEPQIMAAMARAAVEGGAVGVRANGKDDVQAVKAAIRVPVIGIFKHTVPGFDVYITPDLERAAQVARAGADVIALDATARPHPEGTAAAFIRLVKGTLHLPVFADVATLEEGVAAAAAGADYVGTTLSGYTGNRPGAGADGPDLELVRDLALALDAPVIAEGRYWTPELVERAFDLGAYAVVVGTAITDPRAITRRFARAVPSGVP